MNLEIDKSLDQTAPHVHAKGAVCPTCLIANVGEEAEPEKAADPESELRTAQLEAIKRDVAMLAIRKRIEKLSTELTEIAEKMKTL
jgi:hypothetical protein